MADQFPDSVNDAADGCFQTVIFFVLTIASLSAGGYILVQGI